MTEVKSLSVRALGDNQTHFSLLTPNWDQYKNMLQEKNAMTGTSTFHWLPAIVLAIAHS